MCKFAWQPLVIGTIFAPCKAQTLRRFIHGGLNLRKARTGAQEHIDICIYNSYRILLLTLNNKARQVSGFREVPSRIELL